MIKKFIHAIFLVSVVLWFFLATIRIVNYSFTLFSRDFFKAEGYYAGDTTYHAMKKLAASLKKLPESEIYVYSTQEGREFFLLRYFAYPKKIYWDEEKRSPVGPHKVYVNKN